MAVPIATLSIKQGATLQLLLAVQNDDGTPFDLTSVVVTSQLRAAFGVLIDTLNVTPTAIPGQLAVKEDTALWPIGRLLCDLKFTTIATPAIILKSDTFAIDVLLAVTA